ncbi:GNAT family N-acetyltransferase [uncultured Thiodictyon sp.]|uniref:GNAT family N-acetyltransferase n=1 Tax=uncultured Thiodictyon sp. TaxID=1846217 RepID=UPI0025DDD8E8|nr:GNAT family N-acetyltransferase [uncultured Thiodictyon sp.]
MMDARNYAVEVTLKSGASAAVRAIRLDDKSGIVAAFEALEPQSIYTRFFQVKKHLSDTDLKRATEVDFENEVALVATVRQGQRETIVGSGRFIVYLDPEIGRSAEIAFVVEEDYQGQGLARQLLRHLAGIAREQGLKRFTAEVLPGNASMLAVFARCGFPMTIRRLDDVVQVILRLDE